MSEFTNPLNPNQQPSIDDIYLEKRRQHDQETLKLLDMQIEHAKVLDELGITAAAKRSLDATGKSWLLKGVVRPAVAFQVDYAAGEKITSYGVMLFTRDPDEPTMQGVVNFENQVFVPVLSAGEQGEDASPIINHEFYGSQADVVVGMVKELREARDSGNLPNLRGNVATIAPTY